jgi:hypothetical protein
MQRDWTMNTPPPRRTAYKSIIKNNDSIADFVPFVTNCQNPLH